MEISQSLDELTKMFKGQDWFYDVGVDQYNRLVVYVKYGCQATLLNIPDSINGQHVLVHFAASHTATRAHFTAAEVRKAPVLELAIEEDEEVLYPNQPNVDLLTQELDRLEKICGSNILQDIFYEVHDGSNAVTNLASKYPEVKESLVKLYDDYGFDIIYEELDG